VAPQTIAMSSDGVCDDTMDANALIDAGAIFALLDRTDRRHRIRVDAFQ
jgi:hypothetical protein